MNIAPLAPAQAVQAFTLANIHQATLKELASGTPLARGMCGFIAIFWAARLVVQFFVFDAKPYLKTAFLKVGYPGLTVVFIYHVVVYGWATATRCVP